MEYFLTLFTAATIIIRLTIIALDKELMAIIVCTVCMGIAGSTTLVAICNHTPVNGFTQAIIENEVLPNKLRFQFQVFYLLCIFDNSPVKLIYMLETFVLKIGAGLFASYSTCAVK